MSIFQTYFGTKEQKIKGVVVSILSVLMIIFIITQLIRVANAAKTPLFANVYEESSFPTGIFPRIAVCPGRNATQIAVINGVQCYFSKTDGSQAAIPTIASTYVIDTISYSCFDINQNREYTATNLTDLIRCTVFTDLNVIVSFFDDKIPPPPNWFGWQVLSYGTDTAIGIIKWFFKGKDAGYQVQAVQQEYRFNPLDTQFGVAFTVEWSWLGEGIYGEFTTYDLWTAIGVIAGWVFLFSNIYKFIIWTCNTAFGLDNNERSTSTRPLPKNYEAI